MRPLRPWLITIWALAGLALVMALMLLPQQARAQALCTRLAPLLDGLRDTRGELVILSAVDHNGARVYFTVAQKGSWSMVVEIKPGVGCIVAHGMGAQLDRGT